jgi:hypothetical protein
MFKTDDALKNTSASATRYLLNYNVRLKFVTEIKVTARGCKSYVTLA